MTPYLDTHPPDEYLREEIATTRNASFAGTVIAAAVIAIAAIVLWFFIAAGDGSSGTVEPTDRPAVTDVEAPGGIPS